MDMQLNPVERSAVHFVGFRGEEYTSAVKVWGPPDFIHFINDVRFRIDLCVGDVAVYANGCESRPYDFNVSDLVDQDPENGV